jgi:hypothetical protein
MKMTQVNSATKSDSLIVTHVTFVTQVTCDLSRSYNHPIKLAQSNP